MSTIDFEDFSRTSSGRRAETLLKGHQTKPKDIFDTMQVQVARVLSNLMDRYKYTTKVICDPVIWSSWTDAEVRVAGMCLAYFVRKRKVQLYAYRAPNGKPSSPAFYCTQPMPQTLGRISTKIVGVNTTGNVLQLMRDRRTPWL